MVARISDDHRPQLPVVGEDIPGPAVPCHVGTARELEMVNQRTRMVGRAVRQPYSDSDDSDNDVLHAEEHDSAVRQVSLRNEWSVDSRTADDSCGEGCAQLDDFNWFLPADDRVGDLPAPESEVDVSDSESEADYIESDSAPLQMTTTAVKLLCPPVVIQTRPMEGCDPASQAASEVDQTRSRGHCCMNLLPSVGESTEWPDVDAPDAVASRKETAGGSSKVGSDICVVPDVLQTAVSVTCLGVRRGSCRRKFGCRQ